MRRPCGLGRVRASERVGGSRCRAGPWAMATFWQRGVGGRDGNPKVGGGDGVARTEVGFSEGSVGALGRPQIWTRTVGRSKLVVERDVGRQVQRSTDVDRAGDP